MLKIRLGGFATLAREEMKSEIEALTRRGIRTVLIVPEQKTVTAEAEMSEFLPSYSPLTFEVTNFTRLANSVFRSIGGIAGEYCDGAKEALIMWQVLTELSPVLKVLGGKEISTGLVERALAAVREIKRTATSPEKLMEITESDAVRSDKRLRDKLTDIAEIMTAFKGMMKERYTDVGEDLDTLIKIISEDPDILHGTSFFIEGFTSFTKPQYGLIEELMRICDVTVLLTMPKSGRDGYEYTEVEDTRSRLSSLASSVGIRKEQKFSDSPLPGTSPVPSELGSLLWRSSGTATADADALRAALRIFEASDAYEEARFIAADIKRRVMEGERFSDFAIVTRDIASYLGILDTELELADIPAFISKRKQIFTYEEIKVIYAALAVVKSDFSRDAVISYMKCGLSGIDRDACDIFEIYTEKWGISGERFYDGVLWNMNTNGLDGAPSELNSARLILINDTRVRLISPLVRLSDALSDAPTVRMKARALYDFLIDISLPERIRERRFELSEVGEEASAAMHDGLWRMLCDTLDTLVEVLGDTEADIPSFESRLKIVQSFIDLGRIPAFCDVVTVGSADMLRISQKKHLYLMGVNDGEFPRAPQRSSFFTDRDKLILSEFELASDHESDIAYARELLSFSRALMSASNDITVTYSVRDSAFEKKLPSDVIKRLVEICRAEVTVTPISGIPYSERIYSPEAALELIPEMSGAAEAETERAILAAGYGDKLTVSRADIKNIEMKLGAEILETEYKGDISLSQSRMETFLACPFKYFLRYTVALVGNERAEFNPRNIGNFIHKILESVFTVIKSRGVESVDADERRRLVEDAAKGFISRISDGTEIQTKRERVMIDRIIGATLPIVEILCDEMRECSFKLFGFELGMSNTDELRPDKITVPLDHGANAALSGYIDRIDTYNAPNGDVYVRVIDYKTGPKTFRPEDLNNGKNMQMFLYLRAIVESKKPSFRDYIGAEGDAKIIPAGVIYINTDLSDVSIAHDDAAGEKEAIKKKQERFGMLLNSLDVIKLMNTDYLPIKLVSNGKKVYAPHQKLLYTMEEWDGMVEKLDKNIGAIAESMRGGEISADPEDADACRSCEFKAICRNARKQKH